MSEYPIIVRNRVAWFYRGFMIVWLGGVALATYAALRDGPPEPGRWWPLIMLAFWAMGVFALAWSLKQETSVVRIESDGSILIVRGPALRRTQCRTDHARFWIEDTQDSEGAAYFRLMIDAPGGKLAAREGHGRGELERLLAQVQSAMRR